jgi:CRISPR-associated exonuclease Cas4
MSFHLSVSDLRQYDYCARIVYFTHCVGMGRRRPTTYKMQEGSLAHEQVAWLEERRTLRSYGLTEGKREFDVRLNSTALELSGLLDMLIVTPTEAIPVEYKNSTYDQVGSNHMVQLGAYALMIEEQWGVAVKRAFVHFIPTKTSHEVELTPILKEHTLKQLHNIHQMVENESLPDATRFRGRCSDCEFRNFCPDVW